MNTQDGVVEMKKLNWKQSIAGVALCAAGTVAQAAGAYVSNAVGANITTPNTWFRTNFPIVGSPPPAGSTVSSVSWNYGIGTIPSGGTFAARLCHGTTLSCIDVTNVKSGSSSVFAGRPATSAFFLEYRINRTTAFPQVYGQSAQLIVNWN